MDCGRHSGAPCSSSEGLSLFRRPRAFENMAGIAGVSSDGASVIAINDAEESRESDIALSLESFRVVICINRYITY